MDLKLWHLSNDARALRDKISQHGDALGMTDREIVEAFQNADRAFEAIRQAEDRLRYSRRTEGAQ